LSRDPLPEPWAEDPAKVLELLGSSLERGLSEADAQERLRRYGANRLRTTERRSVWRMLWDQFASLIVLLLAAASAVAFAFGDHVEGAAIVAVIFINATIGFTTERRATRSMEALRELGHSDATVRRDGSVRVLPAHLLVPGDIVVLDAGDVLTADLRLATGSNLQVDESPLTGESLPVDKGIEAISRDAPLGERTSMVFKGTAITRGSGEAVVVATGMSTELGQISALVETAEAESTPLEKRLDRLARRLVGLTIAIAVVVAAIVITSGREPVLAIEIAIALAVATIPEGLPIVATVALARGMWRMARRNALVERLSAVETLGSTTVILTDKTGTLTENRMTVVELRVGDDRIEVEGTGLETAGRFRIGPDPIDPQQLPALCETLQAAVLCNNATLESVPDAEPRVTGDPMEVALLVAGAKAGLARQAQLEELPEIREIAFDPETKRMATLHGRQAVGGEEGAVVAAIKGAPEALLSSCTQVSSREGVGPLDAAGRSRWSERADEMAASGQRVLALASQRLGSADDFRFEGSTLLGLVGFFDPPRERVRSAIDACQASGIRVVMVTGDHGATAWNVASAVGLIDAESGETKAFIDGASLGPIAELSDVDARALLAVPVVARASPRQKLELIELYQKHGSVVAMTGDGVNDAPALKKADIGVAMGQRGTQVAREAADIVLRDDELGTIVEAVAQGRAIFANIRKFVVYLMSCNVSEIFAVALGAAAQGPLPILPLQILFLNLVTDVFPALALGVGEGSPALMRQPPRDPQEPVLGRTEWRRIFGLGAVMSFSVLGALAIAVTILEMPSQRATTATFLTLALAQLWHVFSMRNPGSGWWDNEITRNAWVWAALGLCIGLLLAAVYLPGLARVLSLVHPGADGWLLALAASLVPLLAGQLSLARRASTEGGGAAGHEPCSEK